MRLSPLQKYILKTSYTVPPKIVKRTIFESFYKEQKVRPKAGDLVNIITKSLENLIDKGILTGYGVRTPQKWYIKEVKLTALGRRITRELLGKQQELPLKLKRVGISSKLLVGNTK